ncbi:MAG: histone deacetylase, partial [Alphaproteobacteria bacterium]
MKIFYSDRFALPLPPGHRFPRRKYPLLREQLLAEDLIEEAYLHASPLARAEDVQRAHAEEYVEAFEGGALDGKAMRRIGFPWSEALVKRTRATVGGAVAAAEAAL